MTTFMKNLVSDVHGGRESWRVLVTASAVSLLLSIAVALSRQPF